MDDATQQRWLLLADLLLNPWVVGAIMLVTGLAMALLWRHTGKWQRLWMVVILVLYALWLLAAIFWDVEVPA